MSGSSSMLEFVRKAFAEGGAQLEVLSNMLECPELLPPDMSTCDKVNLALSEVLRLRSSVQSLQQQLSHVLQERERMNLLVWSELSRLANKLDASSPTPTTTASADPPHRLLEDSSLVKSDPLLRALLGSGNGASTCPASSCTDTPRDSPPEARSAKRHRTTMETESVEDEAAESGSRRSPEAGCSEQAYFIDAWIAKQRDGHRHSRSTAVLWGLRPEEAWHCYVCGQEAKEPPGDHFCVGKFDAGHREGLKVFCQYCHKGTARMPDLRVHFRKIVYCRILRSELKKKIVTGPEGAAARPPDEGDPEETPAEDPPTA